MRDACGTRFTGAVARVERGGRLAFERAYGATRDDELTRPVFADTAFDLASLTKIFVSTLALRALERKSLTLDGSLLRWFPEWTDRPQAAITLRMLLAHTSGMNSGADYRQLLGSDVERFAVERELTQPPGESVIYSDLGFIAIGVLLSRVSGISLATLVQEEFGAADPLYRPVLARHSWIPATEAESWRGRVQGFVHDEKAYLMGGTAGHAGLFGTALSVARLTESFLGAYRGRATSLPAGLVHEATREQAFDPVLRRGLGWALKTTDQNSCGALFSKASFGHTGFVGTCVWADPERDLQAVLLTNSVYFGRSDTRDLRAAFYDAVVEDFA